MPEYKSQHTVPEFYLKRFSKNEKNINVWNISQEQKIIGRPEIKNECCKNYFYSKEPEFEKSLGSIEERASNALKEIDNKEDLPPRGSQEHEILAFFTILQHARTESKSRISREMAEKVQTQIDEKWERLREQPKVRLSKGPPEIFPEEKHEQNQSTLNMYLRTWRSILDMDYRLLINESKTDFITSDAPVVLYNQFLPDRKYGTNTGLKMRGLEIFFPIDSKKSILFFDPTSYSIGEEAGKAMCVGNESDINEINKLQICSAAKKIYFKEDSLNIEKIHEEAIQYRRKLESKAPEAKGSYIPVVFDEIRANLHLSFVRINESAEGWRDNQFKKIDDEYTILLEKFLNWDDPHSSNRETERRLMELQRQTYRPAYTH